MCAEFDVGGAADRAVEIRSQVVDIGVDAVFEGGRGRVDWRLAAAVLTGDQDELVVVQQIAELHRHTPHGP